MKSKIKLLGGILCVHAMVTQVQAYDLSNYDFSKKIEHEDFIFVPSKWGSFDQAYFFKNYQYDIVQNELDQTGIYRMRVRHQPTADANGSLRNFMRENNAYTTLKNHFFPEDATLCEPSEALKELLKQSTYSRVLPVRNPMHYGHVCYLTVDFAPSSQKQIEDIQTLLRTNDFMRTEFKIYLESMPEDELDIDFVNLADQEQLVQQEISRLLQNKVLKPFIRNKVQIGWHANLSHLLLNFNKHDALYKSQNPIKLNPNQQVELFEKLLNLSKMPLEQSEATDEITSFSSLNALPKTLYFPLFEKPNFEPTKELIVDIKL